MELDREELARYRQLREAPNQEDKFQDSSAEDSPFKKFPPKGNWTYFGNFYWEPHRRELLNTLFKGRPNVGDS